MNKSISTKNSLAIQANFAVGLMSCATMYMVEVSSQEHQGIVREHERSANAGCITSYDKENDRTSWFVAQKLIAVSEGMLGSRKAYWAIVALTPHQHAIAVDQVSNNDVSDDKELIEHLFNEARIPRAEASALLIERNRCLVQPFFEPLQMTHTPSSVGASH